MQDFNKKKIYNLAKRVYTANHRKQKVRKIFINNKQWKRKDFEMQKYICDFAICKEPAVQYNICDASRFVPLLKSKLKMMHLENSANYFTEFWQIKSLGNL